VTYDGEVSCARVSRGNEEKREGGGAKGRGRDYGEQDRRYTALEVSIAG